jgi:hypothetical protein
MKTGTIIYIAGSEKIEEDFDVEQAIKKLNLTSDKVEVVSSKIGHFNIMDAWWLLMANLCKEGEHLDDNSC